MVPFPSLLLRAFSFLWDESVIVRFLFSPTEAEEGDFQRLPPLQRPERSISRKEENQSVNLQCNL